ncbi:MAG TPA: MFS transporter [Clostridia bacterium]|nr:MFS transporter [Clostridia bacterium]
MPQLNNWRKKYFTILTGQAISMVTSGILQMALIFYLTEKTGSALVLSLATFFGFLPQAVLGPFIGVWVDRWSRKAVMIGADLFIALAGVALAVIALNAQPPIWVVLGILFLRSVGSAFHSPAMSAVTPLIVPEDQLVKCAGYSSSIQSISFLVSPALGAVLYARWSISAIVGLDVVGAIIAVAFVAFIAIPKPPKSDLVGQESFFADLKNGYFAIREDKGLFQMLMIGTLYMLVFMPINALFPLMSMGYFGGTTTHAAIAETAFSAGMLVGGLVLGAWGGFKRRIVTLGLSVILMGVGFAASGLLPTWGFVGFAVLCVVMGFAAPFHGVQSAIFQERIAPECLGRVFSLSMSMMSLAMPIGLMLAGAFAEVIGVHTWFLISGILVILIALLMMSMPAIRALDNKPVPEAAEAVSAVPGAAE